MPSLTIRELPPDEWDRLLTFEPWVTQGAMPPFEHWRFLVAEEAGKILGYCALYNAVHWEPWVIRPEAQHRPGVVRGLIHAGLAILAETQVTAAFCLADAETGALVEHFGFVPSPQTLYVMTVGGIRDSGVH